MQNIKQIAKQILSLVDLTSLNNNDSLNTINNLCKRSSTEFGEVPAICIYSHFITEAKKILQLQSSNTKIATVVNFPYGFPDIEKTIFETELALKRGADEIDVVFPYHSLINGDQNIGTLIIKKVKQLCHNKVVLKVIIESGELKTADLIYKASSISIQAGADFIKTSTGKVPTNATLEASKIMLQAIKEHGTNCGFKASGGIKTVIEAEKYLALAEQIMGQNWINPQTFRFGASGLLDDVISVLTKNHYTSATINSTY